ncbi:MAG: hypothetical protein LYZ69_00415 [Nitrososphaerales archaeon]|nr:hypothetical protein [Nitrososphaerales archaeon]
MRPAPGGWSEVAEAMRTLKLSLPVRLLVPSLLVTSYPKNAIGFSFGGGRVGVALGAGLFGASLALGALLYPVAGLLGVGFPLWLLGTAGTAMFLSSLKPIAFVKPLCSRCRLLPIIQEHEAIHLSGVESDDDVWRSMRSRHSCASLSLDGDPSICWFCPIPRRLKEH